VVANIGDGSNGYPVIEVQTMVSHKLPVIFIVHDSQVWGSRKLFNRGSLAGVCWVPRSTGPDTIKLPNSVTRRAFQ
jgi:hypothetical protein